MANPTKNRQFQPDWVFNFVLKLAVVVCLATLAIGLIMGVSPLISLLRSGVAFIVFATLAWAASLIWPEIEQAVEEEAEAAEEKVAEANNDSGRSEIEADVIYEQSREPATVETAEMEPVG